jgi:hypothetical protein
VEVTTLAKAYHLLENTGVTIGKLDIAPVLFGVALIASGQSSTLCGTLAGQYVMEGFLDLRAPPVIRRLITRLVAIVPALTVISVMGDTGTYQLLIMSQIVLSLQLPFAIVPMIRFTNSKRRMGDFASSSAVAVLAWLSAGITVVLNIAYVVHSLMDVAATGSRVVKVLALGLAFPAFFLVMCFLVWIALRAEKGSDVSAYRLEDERDFLLDNVDSGSDRGDARGSTESTDISEENDKTIPLKKPNSLAAT